MYTDSYESFLLVEEHGYYYYLCSNRYTTPHCSEQNSLELLSSPQFLQCPFLSIFLCQQNHIMEHRTRFMRYATSDVWLMVSWVWSTSFATRIVPILHYITMSFNHFSWQRSRSISIPLSDIFHYDNNYYCRCLL